MFNVGDLLNFKVGDSVMVDLVDGTGFNGEILFISSEKSVVRIDTCFGEIEFGFEDIVYFGKEEF